MPKIDEFTIEKIMDAAKIEDMRVLALQ